MDDEGLMVKNVKHGPLFLTPQVIRGLQGIGHAKRMASVRVRSDIKLKDEIPERAVRYGSQGPRRDVIGRRREESSSPPQTNGVNDG
jgi:hypothetical protein